MRKGIISICCTLTFISFVASNTIDPNDNYLIAQSKWADSLLNTMTTEEKIGQLFMVATFSNRNETYYQQVENQVLSYKLGGLIFFQGNPFTQASLTNRYQALSRIPMMIGIDAEWGLGMRLDNTISFPKNITLGAIQDHKIIERVGEEVGRHCRRIGVHINFAPDADINTNPNNPIINFRSFGEDKVNVAEKAVAFVRGMKKFNILSSAKHFPGHGDTSQDSHRTLPFIDKSKQQLYENEFYPFQRLIADSVGSVMTGHLFVPSIEPRINTPASISQKIVLNIIRDEMGFQGLLVTDALNMRGITNGLQAGEPDLLAFMAGNDVLLQTGNLPAAYNRIKLAVETGQIKIEELNNRVRRILKAKFWMGLNKYRPVDMNNLYNDLNNQSALNLKEELYEKAITIIRNEDGLLPFMNLDTTSFASVAISGQYNNEFQRKLSQYADFKHFVVPFKPNSDKDVQWVLEEAARHEVVVVSVHEMNSAANSNYGVTPATISFINQLKLRTKVIVVGFGNPYGMKLYNGVNNLVCGYEDDPASHRVVPQILFGALPAVGKLPVTIEYNTRVGTGIETPKLGRVSFGTPESTGMNSSKLNEIDNIVQQSINAQAFPGCQVLVARKGKIVYSKNFGNLRYGWTEPVNDQTLYDIASITKVASTLQSVMILNERGAIDLNEKASTYLPELLGSNKANMLISDILLHQAGLVAFVPFWNNTKNGSSFKTEFYKFSKTAETDLEIAPNLYATPAIRDSLWSWVIQSRLTNAYDKFGGYRMVYSDLGLVILQKIVERITNQSLDEFVEQNIYEPLGMTSTLYNPTRKFSKTNIAPTENDVAFRGTQIQGTVHDPTAAILGGVSGNAGLFSNALDLVKLFQMNLQNGVYGGRRILFEGTVKHFAKNWTSKSHRGLGWDKPDFEKESSTISLMASPNTYGHTGFTGTCVWVDPDKELIFILLSNRVYPSVRNTITTLKVRKRLHDVVYEALM